MQIGLIIVDNIIYEEQLKELQPNEHYYMINTTKNNTPVELSNYIVKAYNETEAHLLLKNAINKRKIIELKEMVYELEVEIEFIAQVNESNLIQKEQ